MNWSQFQQTATRLAQGPIEGDWRSSVSRSYYAVYHYFAEFLSAHGLSLGRASQCHHNLYIGLMNCGVPEIARIGSRVDTLRYHRTLADYDFGQPMTQGFAQRALLELAAIIADFRAELTQTKSGDVVDGMRRYLKTVGRIP